MILQIILSVSRGIQASLFGELYGELLTDRVANDANKKNGTGSNNRYRPIVNHA
jgi:hypothetical protein